jgi:adenylate cyclase
MNEQRKLAAIMFTDIVGYTTTMSEDEQKALLILQSNRDVLKPVIVSHNGEWLKEMGDGTLSSFTSAVEAVNCALEIQRLLKDETDFQLRIGIHIGDVVISKSDIFGSGVNVASRIETLAEPGGICISERVYDDISNKPGIETAYIGEKKLKNVSQPIKIYALCGEGLPKPRVERTVIEDNESDISLLELLTN